MMRPLTPAALLAALCLAACSGDDPTPEPTDGPGGTPTATQVQTSTPTATPTQASTPTGNPTTAPTPSEVATPTQGVGTSTPTESATQTPFATQVPTPTATESLDKDGDGYIEPDDCNDLVATIYPGATESCDGLDQDCDENVDEGVPVITYYADDDSDGYGDPSDTIESCNNLPGLVENADDCDDNDASLNPETNWYPDADADGYGGDDGAIQQCEAPMGFTREGGDCDDDNSALNPGAAETCDGTDEDCDGVIDNDSPCYDDDGDGFCEADCVDGSTEGDCDDSDAFSFPGAPERFDWKDNDCDDLPESTNLFMLDLAQVQLGGYLTGSRFGEALASNGNFDGDVSSGGHDIDDLVVGAPLEDPAGIEKGAVYLLKGRESGWPTTFTLMKDMEGVIRMDGEINTGKLGRAVSYVGDMNGDGLAELAAAAPEAAVAQQSIASAGSTYVLYGTTASLPSGPISAVAATRVDGTSANVELGTSLSGGDLDGDRLADLIIGAPDQSDSQIWQNSGWAFILRGQQSRYPNVIGPNGVEKLRGSPEEGLGQSVAFLGNFRGGTSRDFVLGGKGNAEKSGLAQVVTGQAQYQGIVNTTDLEAARYSGVDLGEEVGIYVDGNLDINGDDIMDLFVGRRFREASPQDSEVRDDALGYAVFGSEGLGQDNGSLESLADVRFIHPTNADPCPCAVTAIGDMDGDGLGDLAISAALAGPSGDIGARNGIGRIWIVYGRVSWPTEIDLSTEADAILEGVIPDARPGFTMSGGGDLNGDGYDDLVIAAPVAALDNGGEAPLGNVGRIYIQFGAPRPEDR